MTLSPIARSPFSARAERLPNTGLGEVFLMSYAAQVDLAIGTPRFPDTTDELITAAERAMRDGRNQTELPFGDRPLRQYVAGRFNAPTDPDTEITITVGATAGLTAALLASVDPGDEVILLVPGFDQFFDTVALAGATPRFVRLRGPEWRFDPAELAAAFSSRTRAIVLNTPSNPTGRVLTRDELDQIAALCEKWDVTAICDEVYSAFVFDDRPYLSVADVPGLAERSIVVGSLSKSHALSGWRLGYLRADRKRTEVLRRVHYLTTFSAAVPLQAAAAAAAPALDLSKVLVRMTERRDLAQQIFHDYGMEFAQVEGGVFIFAEISALTGKRYGGMPFVRELMERTGVLVVPGTVFFDDPAEGDQYVRIAFNRPLETLRAAQDRLSRTAPQPERAR
ncbi:pyridoxal phosphate-dependent aminotransferase [Nocardia sp. NPDC060256]|uniref:pyridoxal phosphate-dependent aminotransferase n=1 Tax=unclassified Nocardia TaxID=2637762 RepID=UPI003651D69F